MTPTIRQSGNSRPHEFATGYKYESNRSARLETTPPLNHRKGTIRGFLAMLSVFAALAFAWSMLP